MYFPGHGFFHRDTKGVGYIITPRLVCSTSSCIVFDTAPLVPAKAACVNDPPQGSQKTERSALFYGYLLGGIQTPFAHQMATGPTLPGCGATEDWGFGPLLRNLRRVGKMDGKEDRRNLEEGGMFVAIHYPVSSLVL